MSIKNPLKQDAPLYRFLNFVGHLIILNFCFIVGSLLVVTIGASSAALVYALKHDMSVSDYKKGFKENWRQGTVVFFISLAMVVIAAAIIYSFINRGLSSKLVFATAILLAFSGSMIYSWGIIYIVYFDASDLTIIKNSIIIGFANIIRSISAVITVAVTPVVFIFLPYWGLRFGFIWLSLGFSLIFYSNFLLTRPIFVDMIAKKS